MSTESGEKVVQTRLDADDYEQFRRVADQEDLSLKAALRTAAVEFAASHGEHDPSDPFFGGPAADVASARRDEPDEDGNDNESVCGDFRADNTEAYLYGTE